MNIYQIRHTILVKHVAQRITPGQLKTELLEKFPSVKPQSVNPSDCFYSDRKRAGSTCPECGKLGGFAVNRNGVVDMGASGWGGISTVYVPTGNTRNSGWALGGIPVGSGPTQDREDGTRELWNTNDPKLWQRALSRYWTFVNPSNLALERDMGQLNAEVVRKIDAQAWYRFLLEKYFRWKYTAPNRYASTTKILKSYAENNQLALLHAIKDRLFAVDKDDIQSCLAVALSIRGLGTAGASGLLAVLFPAQFGTVDQFAVKALVKISELPERDRVAAMNPESLKLSEGAVLIRIMRRKAADLNRAFSTTEWTPRKVDMVLWTCAR
jgi:hypothetical protein